MYVCIYVCTYVWMDVCMYVCMYGWMDGWMDGCICTCSKVMLYGVNRMRIRHVIVTSAEITTIFAMI